MGGVEGGRMGGACCCKATRVLREVSGEQGSEGGKEREEGDREGRRREGKGREERGREGKGMEGKEREGREGKERGSKVGGR